MPVHIRKLPKGGYRVSHEGIVSAKHTTLKKARAQRRLLYGVASGWKPTGGKRK